MNNFIRFFLASIVTISLLCISSCNKKESNIDVKETEEILQINGTRDFLTSISTALSVDTKSVELTDEDARAYLLPFFQPSYEYLTLNGYDFHEDFEEGDPAIILTALTLADLNTIINTQTKGLTAGEIVGCVLIGEEINDLVSKGVQWAIKKIAKKALQRAIPYVGWAITIGSAGACLYDSWND